MASNTPNLNLLKKDPVTDGNDTFNIQTMINDNWDKIDEIVGQLEEDLNEVNIPLSDETNGIRSSVAGSEKAVGLVMQAANAANLAADAAQTKADQAFQLGNERKQEVVDALIALGVTASIGDSWDTLISKMSAIIKATGNATAADVLAGKTFSNASGNSLQGAMPNNGVGGIVTPGTSTQTKPAGYYSSPIAMLGDPNLVPSNIRSGMNLFGVVGELVEGVPFAENIENYAILGNKSDLEDVLVIDRTGFFNFTPKKVFVKVSYFSARYNDGSGDGHGTGSDTLIGPFRSPIGYRTIGAMDWECLVRVDITTNGLKFYKRTRYRGDFTSSDSFKLLGFLVFG